VGDLQTHFAVAVTAAPGEGEGKALPHPDGEDALAAVVRVRVCHFAQGRPAARHSDHLLPHPPRLPAGLAALAGVCKVRCEDHDFRDRAAVHLDRLAGAGDPRLWDVLGVSGPLPGPPRVGSSHAGRRACDFVNGGEP
jgi:hypothetical protein